MLLPISSPSHFNILLQSLCPDYLYLFLIFPPNIHKQTKTTTFVSYFPDSFYKTEDKVVLRTALVDQFQKQMYIRIIIYFGINSTDTVVALKHSTMIERKCLLSMKSYYINIALDCDHKNSENLLNILISRLEFYSNLRISDVYFLI